MHLTSADARAAREGFHFVVMRGGTRVAYTTTAAEAKRECGKGCKVYPLARMRYAAQNPKAKAKVVAHDALGQVIKAGDAVEVLRGRHDGLSGVVRSVYDGYVEFPVGMMGRTVTVAAKDCLVKRSNPANKQAMLASLDRRIEAAERAGMPVAYMLEQRDLLARRKKANPSFNKWLDTFLEEKEIDLEEVLEVKGKQWGTNYIPVGVLVQAMKRAPKHEQEAIKTMLVKIDFRNAPVRPYLAHLGQAIARNPRPNPGLTKAGKRHLIQTMHKAGADTFTKKMRYVRKHMPNITDPAAFVGYVMQGEKR